MHVMHKVIFFWNIVLVTFRQIWYISDSLKALRIIPMRFLPQLLHAGRKFMILIISSNRCLCSIFKKLWNTGALCNSISAITWKASYQLLINLLEWEFCGKVLFSHSFGRFTRKNTRIASFHKVSTSGN